jgi:hypothetical protein
MKNFLFFSLLLLLLSCNKNNSKTQTPTPTPTPTPTTPTPKQVQLFITYGGANNFCSIKWRWDDPTTTTIDESIDSSYVSTNVQGMRTITNTTTSDSIFVYTSSYIGGVPGQQSNTVLVTVNGLVKLQYSGLQVARTVVLN